MTAEAFLTDIQRVFRNAHFPEATQAITGRQRNFGYLVIDRGDICIYQVNGKHFDATACAATVLQASAEAHMLDWQQHIYRTYCNVTIDLDPAAGDVTVQTSPDTDLKSLVDAHCALL